MKVYVYCLESGIYLGEDFTDLSFERQDARLLPAGTTAIAPPRWEPRQVPVFLRQEDRWELRLLSSLKTPPCRLRATER